MDTSALTEPAHVKAASPARRLSVAVRRVTWAAAFAILALVYDGMGPAKDARARLDACVAAYGLPQELSANTPTAASRSNARDNRNQVLAAALLACSTQP
jgi:hypothetical protein